MTTVEKISLHKECDKQNLGVIFEFTAPGTPQQNSVVERKMPTLMGRGRAMLIQAGINAKEKGEFWCVVISTATNLDNIMVRPERTKPPFTLFYNKDAKYMKHLRSFREMKNILQSSLNAAVSPTAKPTGSQPMRPAPIDEWQGLLSSATGQRQAVGRGWKKSQME